MTSLRLTISAVLALALSAGAAEAAPEGPRVTVLGGLERTDTAPGTGATDGGYYGIQLGYDWDLGGIEAGVEGELGDSTASATFAGQPATQGLFANAAVRLAVPVTSGSRVFVRGGYAYHQIDYAAAPRFSGSGYVLGGGAELDVGESLLIRGEYRYSDYGQQVRGQHFLLGLGLRF